MSGRTIQYLLGRAPLERFYKRQCRMLCDLSENICPITSGARPKGASDKRRCRMLCGVSENVRPIPCGARPESAWPKRQ